MNPPIFSRCGLRLSWDTNPYGGSVTIASIESGANSAMRSRQSPCRIVIVIRRRPG